MKLFTTLFAALLLIGPGLRAAEPIVLGNKRISVITPTLVRLEYAVEGRCVDAPTLFAMQRPPMAEYEMTPLGDDRYEIRTPAMRMVVQDDGLPFGVQNFTIFFTLDGQEKKINVASSQSRNLGGAISTLDAIRHRVPLDEGLLSRDGWYMVRDTGSDLLAGDSLQPRDTRSHLQDIYCFVYGNDLRQALRDLGTVSGRVPMTRKYIHGVWYCRWWNYTAQDYIDIIDGYAEHDFPLDNIVFDMGWHTNDATRGMGHAGRYYWTGYTWNRELLPDPAGLIGEIHRRGITVSLNDHPHDGIRPNEECYAGFMKDMGQDPASGKAMYFDPSDPRYMKNFFRHAHHPSEDMGVDFWWLDWQQNYVYDKVRGTSTPILQWINRLYFEASKRNGRRGAGYSRWAGFGNHLYPIQFSGDAYSNWEMLGFEIELTSTSGNAGCYYWAHDIGGFYGTADAELYARWTQFGAVSAALRVHSTLDKRLDRRPWLWGEQAEEAMRRSYRLRAQIMPYVYTSVRTTHETMLPLNRAMYIDYSDREEAFANPQQFMFGDLLLAAPITSPGQGDDKRASQKVWFPEGDVWYDLFTHARHEGGTTEQVEKPLDEFPLFVKGGYLLPMQPYTQRPASEPLTQLILRAYPAEAGFTGTFTLYEDDGLSLDYEAGAYAKTDLTYARTDEGGVLTTKIRISPAAGSYEGQARERSYRIELPGIGVRKVLCGRRTLKPLYDGELGCWVVNVPVTSVERAVELTVVEE